MGFLSGRKAPIVAVDFDGVIKSSTDWRNMDTPLVPDCEESLRELKQLGCVLILWTSREPGKEMQKVMEYLIRHNILHYFSSFNENGREIDFNTSRKIYADVYVDDNNAGGFIGWKEVVSYVKKQMG